MPQENKSDQEQYLDTIKGLSRNLKTQDHVLGTAQFTDVTNGTYFQKMYGHRVRYCKPWKKFLIFNGRSWEIDEYGYTQTMIDTMIREMYKDAYAIVDLRHRLDFENHLRKSEAVRRRDSSLTSFAIFIS